MAADIERFLADIQSDETLREAVAAKQGDVDAVIGLAASRGYEFTRAELDAYAATRQLNDAQLDGVAAGRMGNDGDGGGGGDLFTYDVGKKKKKH